MKKRGAAPGAPANNNHEEQVHRLRDSWYKWRAEHPPRNYIGLPLRRVRNKGLGLPSDTSLHFAGGIWTRLQRQDKATSDSSAAGAAPGAPTSPSAKVIGEWLCVPRFRKLEEEGQQTATVGNCGGLSVCRGGGGPACCSNQLFQETTNVSRWWELAKGHPAVARLNSPFMDVVPAENGMALGSLKISIALTGLEFSAGMEVSVKGSPLAVCWWRPLGDGWFPCDIAFARRVWLELCELEWCEAFGECDGSLEEDDADSAAAGAASGAPEGREKKTAHATRVPEMNVSLTDSNSPSSCESTGSADESSSSGTDAESDNFSSWSKKTEKQRRVGISAMLTALHCDGCPVPNPSEFQRILLNASSGEESKGVAQALVGATKQDFFLGKLEEKLQGDDSFDDGRFFCEGFPSLAPAAPGAGQVVEFVSYRHPMWEALLRGWGVNTIPDFLKHLCSQHAGEVRLVSARWVKVAPGVDVRHPAFWTPQFVKEGESRRRLAQRDPGRRLDWHEVHRLFEDNDGETTVLQKYEASSGSPWYKMREGKLVTLAQMYYHGELNNCTAFDIYKVYMDLPILVHNVRHDSDKKSRGRRKRQRRLSGQK